MAHVKVDWKTLDLSASVRYKDPVIFKHGSKSIKIVHVDAQGNERSLIFQGPPMRLPFGFDAQEHGGVEKYKAALGFHSLMLDAEAPGNQNSTDTFAQGAYVVDEQCKWNTLSEAQKREGCEFLQFMQRLDKAHHDLGLNNAENWFGKAQNEQSILSKHTRCVRESNTPEKYSPTLAAKLWQKTEDGAVLTKFFDREKRKLKLVKTQTAIVLERTNEDGSVTTMPTKGLSVIPLLEVKPMWFSKIGFGCPLVCLQFVVLDAPRDYDECAIDFVPAPLYVAPDAQGTEGYDAAEGAEGAAEGGAEGGAAEGGAEPGDIGGPPIKRARVEVAA